MSEVMSIEEYKAYNKKQRRTSKIKEAAFRFWEQCLKEKGFIKSESGISGYMAYILEYRFSKRKFMSDLAFNYKEQVWLVEYEGMVFNSSQGTGKSGHTTPKGYTSNCDKYNLATLMGFKLLRYTALNYKDFSTDLKKIVSN